VRTTHRTATVLVGLLSGPLLTPLPSYAVPAPPEAARAVDPAALREAVRAVRADGAVGVTARVSAPGVRWTYAAGRTRPSGRKARPDDVFRVGSVTKQMIAVLALQQVARGRWKLRTKVDSISPGLLGSHGGVTVKQLLSHTSGLPDYLRPLVANTTTKRKFLDAVSLSYDPLTLLATGLAKDWQFRPGTRWRYSNTNYVALGLLLEESTGKPLSTLLRNRVFRPAKLGQTTYARQPVIRRPHLFEFAFFGR